MTITAAWYTAVLQPACFSHLVMQRDTDIVIMQLIYTHTHTQASTHTHKLKSRQTSTDSNHHESRFLSEHGAFFSLLRQKCHSTSYSCHILSVNTHPSILLLPVPLPPKRQDAHVIVLSWSWPYWLSDVKLIKDNLQKSVVASEGNKITMTKW